MSYQIFLIIHAERHDPPGRKKRSCGKSRTNLPDAEQDGQSTENSEVRWTGSVSGFQDAGLKRVTGSVIYLESSLEYLISYFAIWRIGAVAVPYENRLPWRGITACDQ